MREDDVGRRRLEERERRVEGGKGPQDQGIDVDQGQPSLTKPAAGFGENPPGNKREKRERQEIEETEQPSAT